MWLKAPLCQERKGLWISRLKSQLREVLNILTSCRLTAPVNSKHTEQSPVKADKPDVSLLGVYGQDLTGVGQVRALLESLVHVRRKSVLSSSRTALAPLDCPFHSGFRSFCTIPCTMNTCSYPGETSALQTSLALTFTININIAKDSKALILTQWWDSPWDSVHFPPAHSTPSAPFSPSDKFTFTKPVQIPWWPVSGQMSSHTHSWPYHFIWEKDPSNSLSPFTQDGFH